MVVLLYCSPMLAPGAVEFVPIHFFAGWHKCRPEPGFAFDRFSFVFVVVFINCCLGFCVVSCNSLADASQVIG